MYWLPKQITVFNEHNKNWPSPIFLCKSKVCLRCLRRPIAKKGSSRPNHSFKIACHLKITVQCYRFDCRVYRQRIPEQNTGILRGSIPFPAATPEASLLSSTTLSPVSVTYHPKAHVVNPQNSHTTSIWPPWQHYQPSDWLNTGTDAIQKRNIVC